MGRDNPIRIVFIIGTLDRGGSEGQLVELVSRLDRKRFAPHVCCLAAGGPLQRRAEEAGIPVEMIGFRGFRIYRQPHRVCWQMLRLIAYLRRVRPTILHGYLLWAYTLGAWTARIARIPIVVACRRSLGNFKADKPHYLFMERIANAMTDFWVANAEAVRQDAIRREGLDPARTRVIANGVDASAYDAPGDRRGIRDCLGVSEDGAMVLTVANLIYYKGHQTLLDALQRVRPMVPSARFFLVGEGPKRSELEHAVRTRQLDGYVEFLGERPDVPLLLRAADLLVHPSDEEGFPNAILEAMAAGLPVVATRVGGVPELVEDGITGILVPPCDPPALANAIQTLLRDPSQAWSMGRAARSRALREFSVERMVARTEAFYDEILRAKLGLEFRPGEGWTQQAKALRVRG